MVILLLVNLGVTILGFGLLFFGLYDVYTRQGSIEKMLKGEQTEQVSSMLQDAGREELKRQHDPVRSETPVRPTRTRRRTFRDRSGPTSSR